MKRCNKCGEYKLRSEFHRNRSMTDGLHNWCKVCNLERGRLRDQVYRKKEYYERQKRYRKTLKYKLINRHRFHSLYRTSDKPLVLKKECKFCIGRR